MIRFNSIYDGDKGHILEFFLWSFYTVVISRDSKRKQDFLKFPPTINLSLLFEIQLKTNKQEQSREKKKKNARKKLMPVNET